MAVSRKPALGLKRGGAVANDIGYKYTRNLSRGTWVDTIYPYGRVILSILPKISWDTFHYEGPMVIETDGMEDDEGGGNKSHKKIYNTNGKCTPVVGAPYEVFGGTACELWAKKFPEIPIRKFVDMTGDIDVDVSPPTVVPENPVLLKLIDEAGNAVINPLMLYEGKYTQYGDTFTHWLFDEVVQKITEIAPQFNIKELSLPGLEEDLETSLSDLNVSIGNLRIYRLITENKSNIKIQVATKVLPDIVNHIIEFIVSPSGISIERTRFSVDGIYVQGIMELLQEQVKGLTGRADGIMSTMSEHPNIKSIENYPSFYKFDNHCARLIYLATLLQSVEGKPYAENKKRLPYLTVGQANQLLEQLYSGGRGALCETHFGENYINKLIKLFEGMKYIGDGKLRRPTFARGANIKGGRRIRRKTMKQSRKHKSRPSRRSRV